MLMDRLGVSQPPSNPNLCGMNMDPSTRRGGMLDAATFIARMRLHRPLGKEHFTSIPPHCENWQNKTHLAILAWRTFS